MKKGYSKLSDQYTESGILREEPSRFFLGIHFDEILFLLAYTEVCAPYEAFCLKEQGPAYLQHPAESVSITRKLINKMGEDLLYGNKYTYIREDKAYQYSQAMQFTEAYIRGDMPKEVGGVFQQR